MNFQKDTYIPPYMPEVDVHYTIIQTPEKQTSEYPGCGYGIEIDMVTIHNKPISESISDAILEMYEKDFESEIVTIL